MRQRIGSSGNRLSYIQKRIRHAPTQVSVLLWSQPQFLYYRNTSSGGSKRASWRPISQSSLSFFAESPRDAAWAMRNSPGAAGAAIQSPRLDLALLETSVQHYFENGLAPSTQRTYQAGIQSFTRFCSLVGVSPNIVSQDTLCSYVAYMTNNNCAFQTIKTYLSAIRHFQISNRVSPTPLSSMHRLQLVLRGARRHLATANTEKPRLPITPAILKGIRASWTSRADEFDIVMLWAACCTAFFGFFRAGEITVPSLGSYDSQQHLSFRDVAIDSLQDPQMIRIHLKRSKTDQLGRGTDIFLGRADNDLCPVAALLAYIAIRGDAAGPLFRRSNGDPLTKAWFVTEVRRALSSLGLCQAHYAGHSFRIGAATAAAAAGIEDSTIQALGRWSSAAFLSYIRIPREYLAQTSRQLAALSESPISADRAPSVRSTQQ